MAREVETLVRHRVRICNIGVLRAVDGGDTVDRHHLRGPPLRRRERLEARARGEQLEPIQCAGIGPDFQGFAVVFLCP